MKQYRRWMNRRRMKRALRVWLERGRRERFALVMDASLRALIRDEVATVLYLRAEGRGFSN